MRRLTLITLGGVILALALWSVACSGDAGGSEEPAFTEEQVLRLTESAIDINVPRRSADCVSAEFQSGNQKWVVECKMFFTRSTADTHGEQFSRTLSFVLDDQDGTVKIPESVE